MASEWRDLQTEWEPVSFEWRLCQRPMPLPGATCHCLGYTTQEQADLKLCACRFAAKYGIYDIRPVLPPVRGHHDPDRFYRWSQDVHYQETIVNIWRNRRVQL